MLVNSEYREDIVDLISTRNWLAIAIGTWKHKTDPIKVLSKPEFSLGERVRRVGAMNGGDYLSQDEGIVIGVEVSDSSIVRWYGWVYTIAWLVESHDPGLDVPYRDKEHEDNLMAVG